MQTMPSKNRSSTLVMGVALLVLVVGLIAYGVNQRSKNQVPETDEMSDFAAPENGNAAQPGAGMDAASPAPATGVKGTAEAAPAAEAPSTTAMPAVGQTSVTPALTTLGDVPETHVVQPNETLYSISEMYYNSKIYAGDIEELNGITNPDMIVVGQELLLPRPEALMTTIGQ